jgi:hypothetical protein
MHWLEGHIEGWWQNGATEDAEQVPVIILGALSGSLLLVCRGDTGVLTTVPSDKVRLGWRYDFDTRRWVDIDHLEEDDGDAADGEG